MQKPDVLRQKIQDCFAAQDLPQAQKHLKKLCKMVPNDFQAWYFLGSIKGQLGQFNDAIKALHKALRIEPSSTEALSILGLAFFSAGRHEEAITTYKKLLTFEPNNTDALGNLGAAYLVLEQYQQAIPLLQESLKLESSAVTHANLGKAFHHIRSHDDAQKHLNAALDMEPSSLDALMILGEVSHEQGYYKEALKYYEDAIQYHPNTAEAWNNKALILYDLGKYKSALLALQHATQLRKNYLSAIINIGVCQIAMNDFNVAEKTFKQCIQISPASDEAHFHLGIIQKKLGNSQLALKSQTTALNINPKNYKAHIELGKIYQKMSYHKKSISQFRKAHTLSQGSPYQRDIAMHNLLLSMNYAPNFSQEDIYNAHKNWGLQIEKKVKKLIPEKITTDNKLRIGYFSSDFKAHSVAYFIEPILANHDLKQFEIYCYSNVLKPDETTKRLRTYPVKWRKTCHMNDKVLLKQIIDDKINIFIDLMGHTANNRLSILASKPAPIQMTYLGYPNTTGLSSVDYRIVDKITDTKNDGHYHTESLARLSGCFLCYKPSEDAPKVKDTPMENHGYITFGTFNNSVKITQEVVHLYSNILHATNNSRLVLKNKSFQDVNIRERYISMFKENEIDSSRLSFLSMTPTTIAHLDLYNTIDIALDSFPYNGTTTTCEALYMGTPVITFLGDRHSSRVSASLLTAIGHKELIAESEQDYVKLAIELANDTTRLKNYNENLRADMLESPLCDAPSFTHNLENLYKNVWENYCSGE